MSTLPNPGAQPAVLADEHVFLIGRPPLGEFLGFIQVGTVDGQNADQGVLAQEWRAANDHIKELEKTEKGIADNPPIERLPDNLGHMREDVLANRMFQKAYSVVPCDIAIVELDRVVVYQKQINLAHVRRIQEQLGKSATPEQLFRTCIPFGQPLPPVQIRRVLPGNAYMFISPSNDLRFMDAMVLRGDQIADYQPRGPVAGVIGLVVGFTANCLSVIHAENRLILGNGSHRAFALRESGITHAPCLVQNVTRREELQAVAGDTVNQDPDLYLKSDRPPLLKDYFDARLTMKAKVPRGNRQVKVVFLQESMDI